MTATSKWRSRSPIYKIALGAAFSGTGTNMAAVAVSLHIFNETGSAVWLAGTLLFTFGATGLFNPLAGWMADHFDRKKLMLVVSALSTVCWVLLPFVDDRLVLIGLVSLANVIDLPYDLAARAALPNLVDEADLARANSAFSSAYNLGKFAGPPAGAALFAVAGTDLIFIINGITFALAGLFVLTIDRPFAETPAAASAEAAEAGPGAGKGVLAGFRVCYRDPMILRMLLHTIIAMIVVNTSTVNNVFLVEQFGGSELAFGLLSSTFGLGFLTGSLLGGRIKPGREWRWVLLGAGGLALGWAAVAVTPWFVFVFVAVFGATCADSISGVAAFTLILQRVGDDVRGRVLAVIETTGLAANIVGFALAGLVVSKFAGQGVYGVGAVMLAGGVLIMLTLGRRASSSTEAKAEPAPVTAS